MFTPIKPQFRNHFRQDLINNLMKVSNQGTIQLYKHHVMKECVMYASEMCLEFQKQSDGLISSDWIEHITKETGEALKSILPKDFDNNDITIAVRQVKELLKFPIRNLQEEIDRYYKRL